MDKLAEFMKMIPQSDSATDYGEEPTAEDISAYVVSTLAPVADMMRSASGRYLADGLTVPAMFYQDIIAFATLKLPWCRDQLLAIPIPDIRHALVSLFVGEINGFNFMAKRVTALRQGKPLKLTGNDQELLDKLKKLEQKILFLLGHVISTARHPFWEAFHTEIKQFIIGEFPKLYQAIDALPPGEQKQKNIQLLIMDLTHALLPPL